ncbi:MAG: tRNA guanosine(34) transglycosylase Tgt [Actinobacteria bacterium]|nr:tRNA guanosine(34) transglycosylase Tgt [Actinomycetota bacterium]
MTSALSFELTCSDGGARVGTVSTARGSFQSPCFMPVGTRGAVRAISSADLELIGVKVILANTYHLMLRPGTEIVAGLGGIHGFASFAGHVLTDSGGFQVHSLPSEVDDDGVTFKSVYDGATVRLTPEMAVKAQEQLGSDIQMVLDVCAPFPSSAVQLRTAVERTTSWAARARAAHSLESQALFGIVQGGTDIKLRSEHALRCAEIGFDGYGVGGLSVGEPRSAMLEALAAAVTGLPPDRPRYLMGVGDPVGILESVALGIDMFDCVAPTRMARHGSMLTWSGKLTLRNAAYAKDSTPIEEGCGCPTCLRWSRAYLRHLLMVGDPGAARACTLHNLWWMMDLMVRTREAVQTGELFRLRQDVAQAYR